MTANEKTIIKFYTAFSNADASAMCECYHSKIEFRDPAFGLLKENDVCELWVMLGFVKHMNISDAKIAIDTLDEQLKNIVFKLISNLDSNNGDSN